MLISELKDRLKHAQDIIDETLRDDLPPGFALGVLYHGEPVFQSYSGYADLEARQPVTGDTVFRIGSISKTFTAVAVLQLWEQGCFMLDDPVNDHLKAFALHPPTANAPAITIHHLLSHTSGLGRGETLREFVDVYGHFTGRWDTRYKSLNDFYAPHGLAPAIPAGEKYCYANNGYAILGQLVEDVSGLPFADYMRQNVFNPLHMTASDVVMSERIRPMLARGYRGRSGNYVPIHPTEIIQQGAGAFMCSLKDMMAFLRAIIQQDERLLSIDSWQKMMHPHWQLDPRLWAEAYGMQFYTLEGHRIYNQAGGAGGFNANITFCLDHQFALVALSNRTLTTETVRVTRQLMHHLLNVSPAISETERAVNCPRLPNDELKAYTGYFVPSPSWKTNVDLYIDIGFGGVHIDIDDGRLRMSSDFGRLADGIVLYPDDDDPLLFHGHIGREYPFIFRRDEDGEICCLIFDFHHELHRRPFITSLRHRLNKLVFWGLIAVWLLVIMYRRIRKNQNR